MEDTNKAKQKGKTRRETKPNGKNLVIRKVKPRGRKRQREDRDQEVVISPSVTHHMMISSKYGSSILDSSRRQVLASGSPLRVVTQSSPTAALAYTGKKRN